MEDIHHKARRDMARLLTIKRKDNGPENPNPSNQRNEPLILRLPISNPDCSLATLWGTVSCSNRPQCIVPTARN